MGYHRAGFEVVGVDLAPQPRYPFEFHQANALTVLSDRLIDWEAFDAIHASPPCQAYTTLRTLQSNGATGLPLGEEDEREREDGLRLLRKGHGRQL